MKLSSYIGIALSMVSWSMQYTVCSKSETGNTLMAVNTNPIDIKKKVLKNGLTILVREVHTIPQAAFQIWYQVGSRDEATGEKGIAHLIEHMIFKGTSTYSESDINEIVHKLAGTCNAFTSYDYTGYTFDVPSQNWRPVIDIIADCMTNARFDSQHLASEMKAVIQELKMRRDNYPLTLVEKLRAAMFAGHPYHYPIIGEKQDLFNVQGPDLKRFYQKHYLPNNATIVVVGDVNAAEIFDVVEKKLGNIPSNPNYTRADFQLNEDIISRTVSLFREITQPVCFVAYLIPGSTTGNDDLVDLIQYLLGHGKTSRLQHLLVEETQLVTSLDVWAWNCFDYSTIFVTFEPKNMQDLGRIEQLIQKEIDSLANEIPDAELQRALKQAQVDYYKLLESIHEQASQIGKYYLATNNESYVYTMFTEPIDSLKARVRNLIKTYMRSSVVHRANLLPLNEKDKQEWARLQKKSDELDTTILANHKRTTPVEPGKAVHSIKASPVKDFKFPKAEVIPLENGLTLLLNNSGQTPRISIEGEFKTKYYYDPEDKQGLLKFLSSVMEEGTKKYTSRQLAQELESRGMTLDIYPGGFRMKLLAQDLQKGLELLMDVLTNARFDDADIEKVRAQMLADIDSFWDEPKRFSNFLLKQQIYKGHPFSKSDIGTKESIKSITKADLINWYKTHITPQETSIAIVGNYDKQKLKAALDATLARWTGPKVSSITFPPLAPVKAEENIFTINRDQVILALAGLSIDRLNPDYNKLLLFDQVFGGGVLGSMASRLFQLREHSGLFYTITGSTVVGTTEQPGMVLVKTIVSLDRLAEAEKAIKETIATVIDSITPVELEHAKEAIINNLSKMFESTGTIAQVLLFLNRYKLPQDYYDTLASHLQKITLEQVKEAARKVLDNNKMLSYKVGRQLETKK